MCRHLDAGPRSKIDARPYWKFYCNRKKQKRHLQFVTPNDNSYHCPLWKWKVATDRPRSVKSSSKINAKSFLKRHYQKLLKQWQKRDLNRNFLVAKICAHPMGVQPADVVTLASWEWSCKTLARPVSVIDLKCSKRSGQTGGYVPTLNKSNTYYTAAYVLSFMCETKR